MSDPAAENATEAAGERRQITPQPKRIVNLSNTLGSRPAPRRPQAVPSEPAPPASSATPDPVAVAGRRAGTDADREGSKVPGIP